jgi:hypothetical protein
MESTKSHDNFPLWIPILSNLVSVLIYLSGFIITLSLSWIAAIPYLIFILGIEYRLLSSHCTSCYYWGRWCGFGKGKISARFFKRGDPSKFCGKNFTWREMIPDILVSLIPILVAVILMIIRFSPVVLFALIILIVSATTGTGYIRTNLTCKYCKQREIGCPAEQLFKK